MAYPSGDSRSFLSRMSEPEMLVGLSAVLIGACALVISITQVRIMREEQHASVWPRLFVAKSYNGSGLTIQVVNPGIGPAVIKYIRTTVDDRPATSWPSVLSALVPEQEARNTTTSYLTTRIVQPGEMINALRLPPGEVAEMMHDRLERLAVEICYCSVYDRCWTLASRFGELPPSPQPVAACPAPDEHLFLN